MRYEYKEREKKGYPFVSVRDKYENKLIEVVRKGDQVEITTYVENFKTTKFSMPVDLFEKMYDGLIDKNV